MKEITEDYISFETAKLLKEKGFDEDIDLWYDENGEMFIHPKYDIGHNWRVKQGLKIYQCSTLQMAMKWLRVNYNIHIEPRYFPMPNIYRYVIIHSPTTIENIDSHPQYFNSYEEACEAAIKYCLENLI